MDCETCSKSPDYYCPCTGVFICQSHLGEHCLTTIPHPFENLIQYSDSEKLIKFENEVLSRINYLTKLQAEITLETKNLMKIIEKSYNLIIEKINSKIKEFRSQIFGRRSFRLCEIDQLDQKINSTFANEIILKPFDLGAVCEKINKIYSDASNNFIKTLTKDNQMNEFLKIHTGNILCMAISNDKNYVVTGSDDTSVKIFHANDITLYTCLTHHKKQVNCVDISPNGKFVISGSDDKAVILWDFYMKIYANVYKGHTGRVKTVCFSLNSKLVVSGSDNREIMLWRLGSDKCYKRILVEDVVVYGNFSSDSFYCVAVGSYLQVWDLISLETKSSIEAHPFPISCMAISRLNNLIITSSADNTISCFNSQDLSVKFNFPDQESEIISLCLNSNESNLISGSKDGSASIWCLSSKSKIDDIINVEYPIKALTSSNDSVFISVGYKVWIYSLSQNSLDSTLNLNPFSPGTMSLNDNIALYAEENNLNLYDITENLTINFIQNHDKPIIATCISKNKRYALSSSFGNEKNLMLWDLSSLDFIYELKGHRYDVYCVDFSDDESKCISGDNSGLVIVWNCQDLQTNYYSDIFHDRILNVKFSKSGRNAVIGRLSKTIVVLNLENSEIYGSFYTKNTEVCKILVTDDDRHFITANFDDGVRIWDTQELIQENHFMKLEESDNWLEENQEMKNILKRYLF